MKFIFPQNYNFKNNLFGIFDYTTIFVNILWSAFILFIINFFIKNLNIKIFIFIITSLPLLLFSISGFNGENIIYVFSYMIKFLVKQKLFLFDKNN